MCVWCPWDVSYVGWTMWDLMTSKGTRALSVPLWQCIVHMWNPMARDISGFPQFYTQIEATNANMRIPQKRQDTCIHVRNMRSLHSCVIYVCSYTFLCHVRLWSGGTCGSRAPSPQPHHKFGQSKEVAIIKLPASTFKLDKAINSLPSKEAKMANKEAINSIIIIIPI